MTNLIPWRKTDIRPTRNGRVQPLGAPPWTTTGWKEDPSFAQWMGEAWGIGHPGHGAMPLDVVETDTEIRVRAEVPGVAPADLDVRLVGDVLTLTATKKADDAQHEDGKAYSERRYGALQRAVRLACAVDAARIDAHHEHGVLTVTLPKAEAARPKKIEIRSG